MSAQTQETPVERSGQHWLMDSTQGLSLALNDLLTVQTENLDLIWLPCDQHNNAIFRNALGQMNNNDKSKKFTFSLASQFHFNVLLGRDFVTWLLLWVCDFRWL